MKIPNLLYAQCTYLSCVACKLCDGERLGETRERAIAMVVGDDSVRGGETAQIMTFNKFSFAERE